MIEQSSDLFRMRHSCEHVLTMAMLNLYPDIKMAMGPATKDGFYFDFESAQKISEEDFPAIEKEMKKIIKQKMLFEQEEITVQEARKMFADNPYKQEWIDEIEARGEKLTIYRTGDTFVDLCSGPHVSDTKKIGPFKLLSVAGAYWRGDEKNTMLTRVYGTCFPTKEELTAYLTKREEARKRDHRRLGQDLDLFTFSEYVGPGLPLFTPKGTIIRTELQNALMKISMAYGYEQVTIPHLAKLKLYELSGHAQKFENELFRVSSHYDVEFVMKPVNCPHHTQIFASRMRSYKELPIRYIESTMQYRDEKPGEIGGLTRVRSITCDDGHVFCMVSQIKDEVINLCKIIEEFYTRVGLYGNHWVSLSVRDYSSPDKYIGEAKDWDKAEEMLASISEELRLNAKKMEGEAAIYGPKLDFMFQDALGNERQLATVQIDFAMPKRFGLSYINDEGKEETPVMIHRAILGSYERFLAILIEHFAGAFPVWLSPVQVMVIPVSDTYNEFAQEIHAELISHNIRTQVDTESKTVSNKIRQSTLQKVPYMVIIGEKEFTQSRSQGTPYVSVRTRTKEDMGTQSLPEFISMFHTSIETYQ